MAKDENKEEVNFAEALESDSTLLGEVYNFEIENGGRLSAKETSEQLRPNSSYGFLYSYWATIDAITKQIIPETPSYAEMTAKTLKGFIKRNGHKLNAKSQEQIEITIDKCRQVALDERKRELEEIQDIEDTEQLVESLTKKKVPGIYVYTYQHYRLHAKRPVEENSSKYTIERTLYKIGYTTLDIEKRVYQQEKTGIPESPIIERMYCSDNLLALAQKNPKKLKESLVKLERDIHRLVSIAHPYDGGKGVGKEWFLTNLDFVDEIALQKGLRNLTDDRFSG